MASKYRGMHHRRRTKSNLGRQDLSGFALTLREQAKRIRAAWTSLDVQVTSTNLCVHGQMQPTPLNDTYDIRIVYEKGRTPKAYVESPALKPRDDVHPVPHVYMDPELRPCLYYPDGTQWSSQRSLARTIIPWLAQWLYYYELWHATGEWRGGGARHGSAAGLTDPKPVPIDPPTLKT